jgi:SulP family sulfate permease
MSRALTFFRTAFIPGLTVFTVFVPSAMAYGQLAALSPQAGIYAGLGAMLMYFFIGSSKYMFVGPDASSAIMTAFIVAPLLAGMEDPAKMLLLVSIFSLLVGAFLVIGGLLRLGFLADFISKAPLTGYLSGVALVVFQSQFEKLLGLHTTTSSFFGGLAEVFSQIGETHILTLVIGVVCIISIYVLKRFTPRLPYSLIIVALSVAIVSVFGLDTMGVEIVGSLPSGLPKITFPTFVLSDITLLLPGSAMMALMLFSDVLMTSRAFATRNGETIDANREIVASGVGNLLNGVVGGFPVGANGLYAAVNESNGGKSKLSSLITVISTVVFLFFFASSLEKLPNVVLAAIIIVSCFGLIEVHEIKRMYRFHKLSFALYLITCASVLLFGIVEAISIAVGLTLLLLVYYLTRGTGRLYKKTEAGIALEQARAEKITELLPGVMCYKVDGIIIFPNCERIKGDVLSLVKKHGSLHTVIFDISSNVFIDLTSLAAIESLAVILRLHNIRLILITDHPFVRQLMDRAGTTEIIGNENIIATVDQALQVAC